MSTLTLTRGLPGSGKTTWAKQQGFPRCGRDDLRISLFGSYRLNWEAEEILTRVQRATVLELLKAGDVIADDMNLRPKYIREWERFTRSHGHQIAAHEIPLDLELAIQRDADRERCVGEDVIRGLYAKFTSKGGYLPVAPIEDEVLVGRPYHGTPGKPKAIMVDIDGTVALMGARSPYDTSSVHLDQPNGAVVAAIRSAVAAGDQILYCSGRDSSCRAQTSAWLSEHATTGDDGLFMRAEGDKRRDAVVKAELFDQHIREHYDVQYVLDDRQQVVDMWRSIGLTVFQVAPGDF